MSAVVRTYPFDVDGLGRFTARVRRLRDQVQIEAEALRITGGPCENDNLSRAAMAIATLSTLIQDAPDGWNVDDLDPLDPDAAETFYKVERSLRQAEDKFRRASKAQPEQAGA